MSQAGQGRGQARYLLLLFVGVYLFGYVGMLFGVRGL